MRSAYNLALTLWTYIVLYLLSICYLVKELLQSHRKPVAIGNQDGRVAIVTGSSRGIGLETVAQFLQKNMIVVLCGPNVDELERAVEGLRARRINLGKAYCLHLDLFNLNSVRAFVKEFLSLKLPLHVLVNNAGVMFAPYNTNCDGFESHMSVNYLGHFLLCHLLLSHLEDSATPHQPSRIVNVSSSVHYIGQINFDNINGESYYNPQRAYAQSKLAQVMFTISLSERLQSYSSNVLVNCLHPGVVATDLYVNVAWAQMLPLLANLFLKTPSQGSDTSVHVALSENVSSSGNYYENCSIVASSKAAGNKQQREKLWNISCSALCITNFGKPNIFDAKT